MCYQIIWVTLIKLFKNYLKGWKATKKRISKLILSFKWKPIWYFQSFIDSMWEKSTSKLWVEMGYKYDAAIPSTSLSVAVVEVR